MTTAITVIQKSAAFFLQPLFPVILPAPKLGASPSQYLYDIQCHGGGVEGYMSPEFLILNN